MAAAASSSDQHLSLSDIDLAFSRMHQTKQWKSISSFLSRPIVPIDGQLKKAAAAALPFLFHPPTYPASSFPFSRQASFFTPLCQRRRCRPLTGEISPISQCGWISCRLPSGTDIANRGTLEFAWGLGNEKLASDCFLSLHLQSRTNCLAECVIQNLRQDLQ